MSSPANKFIEIFRYYDVQLSTANEKSVAIDAVRTVA